MDRRLCFDELPVLDLEAVSFTIDTFDFYPLPAQYAGI